MEEKSSKLFLKWEANDAWPIQFIPFAKQREVVFVSGHLTCLLTAQQQLSMSYPLIEG